MQLFTFVFESKRTLNMATTTFFLRKGKRQDSIYVIYRHLDKSKMIATGIKIDPKHWIESKQKIDLTNGLKKTKANEKLIEDLKKQSVSFNASINRVKSKISDIAERMKLEEIEPNVEDVYKEYAGNSGIKIKKGVYDMMDEYIRVSENTKTASTLQTIRNGLETFKDFAKSKTITLNSFDAKLYDDYLEYLFTEIKEGKEIKKKALNNNTAGKKIKILKSFLNYLKQRGYKVNQAFEKYKVLKEDKDIIYLTQDELKKLYEFEFEQPHLTRTRDLFVLQCSTGLRISDLFRLSEEHIKGDHIEMTAYKTKKHVFIPITSIASEILKKYPDGLPQISEQVFNRQIKDAAKIAELNRKIEETYYKAGKKIFSKTPLHEIVSSHVGVKTFISHCVERGISPRVVATITGKTLDILLKNYYGTNKQHIMDEMKKAFGLGNVNMKAS